MRILLPLILLMLPSSAFAELQISNAWIKNLPAVVAVRAGYLSIHNPLDRAITLIGVSSERFGRIEIHQTIAADGVMRMQQLLHLTVTAGATLELSPGGIHLMMMKPTPATKPGESIAVRLQFEDGSEQALTMQVKK